VDVEPALANVIKGGFDDLCQTTDPALLSSGVSDLANAC